MTEPRMTERRITEHRITERSVTDGRKLAKVDNDPKV
jgi:hypothetical protein